MLDGKRVLITGGTGSLGTALVERLLSGQAGNIESVTVYSRDEAKQHDMRRAFPDSKLSFIIGDVRDYSATYAAMMGVDIIFHTAAMKHVTSCEHFPLEALLTNAIGTANIIRGIREFRLPVETVVGVSSDKGVHPVNVYGATKFLQEKILLRANTDSPSTKFVCACYGNVMASRGSMIPVFLKQIQDGGPVTITAPEMTRFLISLDQAVDTLLATLKFAQPGEVYIPLLPAASVADVVSTLINGRNIAVKVIGKRQGEKMHEVLITQEESERVTMRNGYYVLTPYKQAVPAFMDCEYISRDWVLNHNQLRELFMKHGFIKAGVAL